jgi:hypothetical protein
MEAMETVKELKHLKDYNFMLYFIKKRRKLIQSRATASLLGLE